MYLFLGGFQGSGRLARCKLSQSDIRRTNRRAVQICRETSGGGWVDCRTSGQIAGSNFRAAQRRCAGTDRKVARLVGTAGWGPPAASLEKKGAPSAKPRSTEAGNPREGEGTVGNAENQDRVEGR